MASRRPAPITSATRPSRAHAAARPAAPAVAWAVGAPILLLLATGTLVHVISGGDISTTSVALPIAGMTSLLAGLVLVTRLPRHRIGWLLWASGILIATTIVTQALADQGLNNDPGSVPGAVWFAWVAGWVGELALFVPMILLPLLFPTGRPPSPRWRPVMVATIATIAAWSLDAAIAPFDPGTYPPDVQNPLALGGSAAGILGSLSGLLSVALFVQLALALASLVIRYRRASGIERQQLRLFAFVGAIAIVALLVGGGARALPDDPGTTVGNLGWLAAIGALAFMPVAIGIAVLRYRLYEIDRVISRTIGYATVTGILLVVFAGAILLFQALLSSLVSGNTIAVAASTLVVAALFQPLRHRVQARVDRRFNRARYDAERTVATFTSRLRDEVELGQLRAEINATVARTVQPTSLSVWLRD